MPLAMPVVTYLSSGGVATKLRLLKSLRVAENETRSLEADFMFGEIGRCFDGIPFKLDHFSTDNP